MFQNDKQIIRYYRTRNYGVEVEYVHPADSDEAAIIQRLTGKKTITPTIRELLRDLTGGYIQFQQEIQP